jgi:PST family polysaccharide transporter
MFTRNFDFRKLAIIDTLAVIGGGLLGVAIAGAGGGYWAVVAQTVGSDMVGVLVLLAIGGGIWPNLHFGRIREILAYSWRAFAAGLLMNSVSRNLDNLLVGRYQGPEALSFYGLAYRTLLIPIQLAGTTVSSVLLPAFTRLAHDVPALAAELARATRTQASVWLPFMGLMAAAAPQIVLVLFGSPWAPAIPIVQVLAIAGASQAIYQPTIQLLLGTGRANLCLRFSWLSTILSAIGIVSGLPFGPLGVATGYTVASFVLIPAHWLIRRHLVGVSLRSQLAQLVPGCHVALWMAGAYLLVAVAIADRELLVLLLGGVLSLVTGVVVLRTAHRSTYDELQQMAKRVAGKGGAAEEANT